MGQQDLYQSDFYEDRERFADVFNGVLFGGREVMKLFEALSCGKDLKKMRSVLKENLSYKELDELTVKAIAGILKLKINLDGIARVNEEGKVVYDMCQAFEDYKEEGKREGRREGRREGKREGELKMALKNVKNLMKKKKMNFEEAVDLLGITKGMQKELMSLI